MEVSILCIIIKSAFIFNMCMYVPPPPFFFLKDYNCILKETVLVSSHLVGL